MTTGKRIAQKRKELHMTQEAFGEQMGVSRQSVYRWEQDATMPEIDTLLQMSKIFDVSVDWLLCKEENVCVPAAVEENTSAEINRRKPWLRLLSVVLTVVMVTSMILMGWRIGALNRQIQDLKEQLSQGNSSNLPDWMDPHIAIDPGQLVNVYVPVVFLDVSMDWAWGDNTDVRYGLMTYYGTSSAEASITMSLSIQPQDGSSLIYDKKNFTVNLLESTWDLMPDWGQQTQFCWKANYTDPTHAGNVVSARLAGQMNKAYGVLDPAVNGGSIDGFPFWLVINGEAVGLYTWCIPMSAWMFGMDETNPNHIVMGGNGWENGALFCSETYVRDQDWRVEVGDVVTAYTAFDRLYAFIQGSTNEEFKENVDQYLDLDACLNYYCYAMITDARDNLANNMLFATYDGVVWSPALYDLDSLWGIKWDGKELCGGGEELWTFEGVLFERLRTCFGDELKTRYAELRNGVLSEVNIWKEFEMFVAGIPEPYYTYDTAIWNANGEIIRTLDLMKEQVAQYLPRLDALMGYGR